MSNKSRLVDLLLCFFLGALGIHRFYEGKIFTGLIWFFTIGLGGIGTFIDFLMILFGAATDSEGKRITRW